MKEKTTNKVKIKLMRTRMVMTFVSLTFALTSFSYMAFAWFTSIKQSNIKNSNVAVEGVFKYTTLVKVDDVTINDGYLDFSDFYPGDVHRRKLSLTINNVGNEPFVFSWLFEMPLETEEVPFIDTEGAYGEVDNYYYLGSQLQLQDLTTTIGSTSYPGGTGQNKYLVTTSSIGLTKGQVNAVDEELTLDSRLFILEEILLEPTESATTIVYLNFVDNGTNQNAYQNEIMTCIRQLYLFLNYGE